MGQLVIPSGSKVYVDTAVLIYTLEGNKDYFDLLKPLWTKFQAREIELISSELSPEESDYLNVLGTLVFDDEQKTISIPDIYGVELLKVLIAERDLLQKDLVPIFKTESIVSDVLNGKRQLTVRHIQELAQFFNLSPAGFLPQEPGLKATA